MILVCQQSWKVTLKGSGTELDAIVLPTKKGFHKRCYSDLNKSHQPVAAPTCPKERLGRDDSMTTLQPPAWAPKQDFPLMSACHRTDECLGHVTCFHLAFVLDVIAQLIVSTRCDCLHAFSYM